jgi:hypothetical protein
MATKNKALPYILFGVPIAIGIYFIVKSIKDKAKPKQSEQKPLDKVKEDAKTIVDNVKKVVYPIIKKDNFPLKRGSYGDNVKTLQTALMQYNPSLPIGWNDSDFGKLTETELLTLGRKIVDNQNILDSIVRGGQAAVDRRGQSKIDAELKLRNQRLFNQF